VEPSCVRMGLGQDSPSSGWPVGARLVAKRLDSLVGFFLLIFGVFDDEFHRILYDFV
jgi:hypothetical protein